jgi:hypothetical protein
LDYNNNNNNSIHVYLRANLTARRPITKLARVYRNKQPKSNNNNNINNNNNNNNEGEPDHAIMHQL